jgi:hypothetical protein
MANFRADDPLLVTHWRPMWSASRLLATTLSVWLGLIFTPAPAWALSFTVSRDTLQEQVRKAFPKTLKGVNLAEPRIELDGSKKATLVCLAWAQSTLGVKGNLCVESGLVWQPKTSTLVLANTQIRQASVGEGTGLQAPAPVLWALNQAVPAMLDGVQVYKAEGGLTGFVASLVKELQIEQDRVRVVF